VPAKNKMRWYADWLRGQVRKLGIEVKYGSSPSVEELERYDLVVCATGARVARPAVPGADLGFVCAFEDVLRCRSANCPHYPGGGSSRTRKPEPVKCGEKVLVWGDNFGAADSVEKLGIEGHEVWVVTENEEFAAWMEPAHRDVMRKRFRCGNGEGVSLKPFKHAVTVLPRSTVVEIGAGGEVTILDSRFRKSTVVVDTVVLAAVESDDGLYRALSAAGKAAVRVGDCKRVRNLRAAVLEGAHAGFTVDKGFSINANGEIVVRRA
jgi:NADPH-dependent glutamate synthase beta subunit-like oxidoreductase